MHMPPAFGDHPLRIFAQIQKRRPFGIAGGGLVVLMVQTLKVGLNEDNVRRLRCLSMFWHFLDLVWVGVFSYVYLVGVVR